MKKTSFALGFLFVAAAMPLAAEASTRCKVPMGDWLPKEQVEQRLISQGWTIDRLKTDDGCYKIYGKNPQGQRAKVKLDPATLQPVQPEDDDD